MAREAKEAKESAGSASAFTPIQALNRLGDLTLRYISSQAFFAALELGVFEELSRGPQSAEDLAGRLKIHPTGCRRLLMALASLDLIRYEDGLYRNSELGQYCTSASPINLSGLLGMGHPFYRMFESLPDALREYSPRWEQALGTSAEDVFGALYADPARLRQFAELMNAMSVPQGQLIAETFDFKPYTCIMDVAGGPGGQSVQIGLRYPHLKGIVTDMAPVCEVAREYIEANGLSDRFVATPADLFEGPYPEGADVIVIGHILHDWPDDACRQILRNCFAALPAKGALLISETVLNPDFSASRMALMKDLTMLVACDSGGRERNEAEYSALLDDAGFKISEVIHLDAPRDLIVARKA